MECGIRKNQLESYEVVNGREDFLVEISKGKRIVHVGCVGTSNVSDVETLHERLHNSAAYCLGLDLNLKGVNELKDKDNNLNLLCKNAEEITEEDVGENIDYVIFGEVLEHLENAGKTLRAFSKLSETFGAKIIVTVPNAFGWRNFLSVSLFHKEITRLDHYCYYSPVTLNSLARDCNLLVGEMKMYSNVTNYGVVNRKVKNIIFNKVILKVRPGISEGIIAIMESPKV